MNRIKGKYLLVIVIFMVGMALILFLAGGSGKVKNEDRQKYHGQIIDIDESKQKILVKSSDTRIWMVIKKHTKIFKNKDKGSFSDFQIGEAVEVYLDESYIIEQTDPPRAVAFKVVIIMKAKRVLKLRITQN